MDTGPQPLAFGDRARGFELSLPSAPTASATARRHVDALGDALPAPLLADLRTILTELISNCVRHGTNNRIAVAVEVGSDGHVQGAVSDGGSGPVGFSPSRGYDERGLGLRIVDALTTRWGVDEPTSDVWFEIDPPSSLS
jgi:anti-sigma regulatory factor (Ser/Thr protein kinase)